MSSPDRPRAAPSAARGGLFVLGAKVFFIGLGLVQQALLPRVIGLAAYGSLSRALGFANVFNNVVVASSTQGVSRTVAGAGDDRPVALRRTLRWHAGVAAVATLVYVGLAPLYVRFERAPEIAAPVFALAAVLGVYGLYAPLVGALNGTRRFGAQAGLDVLAATLRTAGLLGLGWALVRGGGDGAFGATLGAAAAAAAVCGVALTITGTGASGEPAEPSRVPRAGAYLAFLAPTMLAQLATNALMQADIVVLGRQLSLAGAAAGASPEAANEWVAVYRACQLFAFLPYQLLFSVTQVLFPMLATASADGDRDEVRRLVVRGTRLGAVAGFALVACVAALPESMLGFAYGAEIAARGASTLRVLALAQGMFALLGLGTTVLVSTGRERAALALTGVSVVLVLGAATLAAAAAPFGAAQLRACAVATATALGVALVLAVATLRRAVGAFVPLATLARVAAATGLVVGAGSLVPKLGRVATPAAAAALVLLYLVALLATGEIGPAERAAARGLLRRRSSRTP